MSVSSEAGPSRPVPHRTLPQPSRLTVAQRDASGQLPREAVTDAESLRRDLSRRSDLARKAERWADKLMEETVDARAFMKALSYLNSVQYKEITHERHLNHLCSYPTCANPPAAPWTSKKRFKISTTNRTIKPKEGNEEEGFCCKKCEVRSNWVLGQLDDGQPIWARNARKLELLENQEALSSIEVLRSTAQNGHSEASRISVNSTTKAKEAVKDDLQRALSPRKPPISDGAHRRAGIADTGQVGAASSPLPDIIANLTIHERPTPADQPAAPSLDRPAIPAQSAPVIPPQAELANQSRRKVSSSLVPTPAGLSNTVITASKQMGPFVQDAPDSDEEEKDWGESEMGLDWGAEDDETKALFEEAFKARELMS